LTGRRSGMEGEHHTSGAQLRTGEPGDRGLGCSSAPE
jgi:hypothetical protein